MADSIRELIQKNIDTTLKLISKIGGYNNDIVSVQRYEQSGNDFASCPVIIQYPGDEGKKPGPVPLSSCDFTVYVGVYFKHDKTIDARSTDEIINSFLADVEKALMIDHTRGGYATSTFCSGNAIFQREEGEAYAGLFIEVGIIYDHDRNDPTAQ